MEQQIYKLTDFSTNYQKVDKDKKKEALKSVQFILELNKSIGFDQILLREGFQTYPKKDQIINKRKEESCLSFFNYLKQNLDTIQSNYLRDTNDLKLIEQAQSKNQKEYNFLLNKNSVSKFIRDEASHYQKTLDKYLQAITKDEQQKGIKSKNIHPFLIELFSNKYTVALKDNKPYLIQPTAQIQVQIGNHLYEYGKKMKDLTEEQAKHQYFITEEEMLDFLTFWLKQESNIFILYARTQQRLNKESKFITNQSHLTNAIHPSRMTSEEIIKKQQEISLVKQEQLAKSKQISASSPKISQQQKKQENQKNIQYRTLILKGERSQNNQLQRNNSLDLKGNLNKQPSHEENLSKQMKGIFEFGCKRRYKLNKNTTFQDIQLESKTMTFQKFFNFCTFFELTSILTKQLIQEYFKMFALNLRLLDYSRFESIINKMIKVDKRVAQNLLKKIKFEVNHKKNQIKSDKKSQQKLSGYKFILHPINGKDVSTIEKELSFRRLQKLIVRQQKQRKGYVKREKIEKEQLKVSKKSTPYHSVSKISHAELQPIRDMTFNPQKLISNNENDKLWEAYEAKIWNRDQNSQSALQSILSRRIQRGNIVINKLHSQRSFIYDQ